MPSTDSKAPVSSTGDSAGAHAGTDFIKKAKTAVMGIHGIGEAIRGNANAAMDSASGDTEGVQKNEQIANKGVDQMDQARAVEGHSGAHSGLGPEPASVAKGTKIGR
ncbi:hypothetical protein MMC28_003445 [Mycoblastus sanguinarius]|nr:hypothetical protein [Mycoblastus sanguinarius]